MPKGDHQERSIHHMTGHNAQTAALGVSRRLARVSIVVSPARPPKLMIANVGGETHDVPYSTSGRTDLETDLLPWVTDSESPRMRSDDRLICSWRWSTF